MIHSLDPFMTCPRHGYQPGRTRCKVCNFDPMRQAYRRTILPPGEIRDLGRSPESPLFYTVVENLVLAAMAMIVFILPALYVASFF